MSAPGIPPHDPTNGKPGASSRLGPFFEWLGTPTGVVVGLVWIVLLIASVVVVRPGALTTTIEAGVVFFGLYASSVAFKRDLSSGLVILIALAFTFFLLNVALYYPKLVPFPMAR